MLRTLPLLIALAFAAAACDTDPVADCPEGPGCPDPAFDPSTVDYDTVTSLDYATTVQPLLAARDPFGFAQASAYAYDRLLDSDAGAAIIPFDAANSPLVRLATQALAPGLSAPYPRVDTFEDDEVRLIERWIEDGARGPDGQPGYADASRLLYVCNQLAGRVAVVDVDRRRTVRLVHFEALGQPANAKPHHVVASGGAWYVTLIDGTDGGSVLKMDASLLLDPADPATVLAEETPTDGEATFQKPGMLALDAARGRLYAGRSFSNVGSTGVAAFGDLSALTYEVFTPRDLVHPHAIGVSADGDFVYTAALASSGGQTRVTVLEASTGDTVQELSVPGELSFVSFAVAERDPYVALTSQTGGALYVFDVADGGTLSLRHAVPVGSQPWHPVLAPAAPTAYVPNRLSDTVSVVDLESGRVTRTITNPRFSQPHGSAVSADGALLFVSSRNLGMTSPDGAVGYRPPLRFVVDGVEEPEDLYGNVAVLDAATGAEIAVVQQGRFASGLAYLER